MNTIQTTPIEGQLHGSLADVSHTQFLSPQEMAKRIADGRSPHDFSIESLLGIEYAQEYREFLEKFPDDKGVKESYDEVITDVRQRFIDLRLVTPDEDEKLLKVAAVLKKHSEEHAAELRPEVEGYIKEFKDIALNASKYNGLPLSHEQINERLSGIALSFFDLLHDDLKSGAFYARRRMLRMSVDALDLRKVTFHEMWHALSGVRGADTGIPKGQVFGNDYKNSISIKRHGLGFGEDTTRKGATFDEGMVDMLAIAWAKGVDIDFSASGAKSRRQWVELYNLAFDEGASYPLEIGVVGNIFTGVDAKVVFDAFLKSDFDEIEEDKLAGTHALRTLQRRFKVLGGADRIKDLRLIDRNMDKDGSEEGADRAIEISKKILSQDNDNSRVAERTRRQNSRKFFKLHKRRQAGIKHARRVSSQLNKD